MPQLVSLWKTEPTVRGSCPVFVVGCSRSGTTLLYDMLLSSGRFAVYHAESDVFSLLGPAFGDLRKASNRHKLVETWLKSDHFRRSGLDEEQTKAALERDCRSPGDFLCIIMQSIAAQQHVERWADNTPTHLLYIDEIKKAFPSARFIHILRDGRDVALSLSRMGWVDTLPWDRKHVLTVCAVYWRWMVRKGRKYGRRAGADYLEIRYEDLIQHPRETLDRVGAFIDEELNFSRINEKAVGTVSRPNSSFPDATCRDSFRPVGRWLDMKSEDATRSNAVLATLLRDLGYETENGLRFDFTAIRLSIFYSAYLEMKHLVRRSRFAHWFVHSSRLSEGALDAIDSRWEDIRRSQNPERCMRESTAKHK